MEHRSASGDLLMYDEESFMSCMLLAGYRALLPDAALLSVQGGTPESLRARLDQVPSGALVVLLQTTPFSMNGHRIRVELWARGVKVIEHSNLGRISPDEVEHYIDAMAYDPTYYRGLGEQLRARLDTASRVVVHSGASEPLVFASSFEPCKLNTGDYRAMKNWGSQFPIGELFTEATTLENVSGHVRIYAFCDRAFFVNVPPAPITLVVHGGLVVSTINSTPAFDDVLAQITLDEGCVRVRELGLGMNRAMGPHAIVRDMGAFERAVGVHVSLGQKHGVYKKPHLPPKTARHHVDVMVALDAMDINDARVFASGGWCVPGDAGA